MDTFDTADRLAWQTGRIKIIRVGARGVEDVEQVRSHFYVTEGARRGKVDDSGGGGLNAIVFHQQAAPRITDAEVAP